MRHRSEPDVPRRGLTLPLAKRGHDILVTNPQPGHAPASGHDEKLRQEPAHYHLLAAHLRYQLRVAGASLSLLADLLLLGPDAYPIHAARAAETRFDLDALPMKPGSGADHWP